MTTPRPSLLHQPLSPWKRALAVLATWLLLCLSLPGVGRPGGFGHLAFVALVPWALYVRRPGPKAFLAEWLATGLGMMGVVYWLIYVVPFALVAIPLTAALYMAGTGLLLRRLASRVPLALAVPAAWTVGELVRGWIPVPASFLWHRLGHMAHDTEWLVGAARFGGSFGLTWIFAAFSGMVADLWLLRGQEGGRTLPVAAGVGPLVLGIVATGVWPAPETEPGPRVLVVQPGIEQEVKNFSADQVRDVFGGALELTTEALASIEEAPDLVLWGETLVPATEPTEEALAAARSGAQPPEWTGQRIDKRALDWARIKADALVPGALFGRGPVGALDYSYDWWRRAQAGEALLPPGTCFAAGAEEVIVVDGELRRRNSYFVWDAEGGRGPAAPKRQLVPGGESLMGFHWLPGVLDVMMAAGGYIPDFLPGERSEVLGFEDREGREWRFGVAICFDNVFDAPFLEPVRREPVDFSVVASNEAWYRNSHEMDQMVAMSRVAAVASGRSVVRATNSGTSIVIDPRGRDVAVLEVDGRRKMVRGVLEAVVPVPVRDASGRAPVPLYARYEGWIQALFAALALALACLPAGRGAGQRPESGALEPDSAPVS